jgi:hypothetical protein
MTWNPKITRRDGLRLVAAGAAGLTIETLASRGRLISEEPSSSQHDETIVAGLQAAMDKSLNPAMRQRVYPGHFIEVGYGDENTWPGLDTWEMAGAYLLLGRHREVLDTFDFIQASQRADGDIPIAIFPADHPPEGMDNSLRGLRYPEDVYIYKPMARAGQPTYSDMRPRKWIGLFTHWQVKVNPLSTLGPISFILMAKEIFAVTKSRAWLGEHLPSMDAAGRYLLTRIAPNGLMSGAGFYTESPPRNQWDGVNQCYGIHGLRQLASLNSESGKREAAAEWNRHADTLQKRFLQVFWQRDHFAEYLHPQYGLVDSHGLSDVNWAAIGLEIATEEQIKRLWPILIHEPMFWRGGMPTFSATKPFDYKQWEFSEPLPFPYEGYDTNTHDVAAMGRVWYLEVLACQRLMAYERLRASVVKVCRRGNQEGGLWWERYRASREKPDSVEGCGAFGYCEYPAILIRTVLQNPGVFPEARTLLSST